MEKKRNSRCVGLTSSVSNYDVYVFLSFFSLFSYSPFVGRHGCDRVSRLVDAARAGDHRDQR